MPILVMLYMCAHYSRYNNIDYQVTNVIRNSDLNRDSHCEHLMFNLYNSNIIYNAITAYYKGTTFIFLRSKSKTLLTLRR